MQIQEICAQEDPKGAASFLTQRRHWRAAEEGLGEGKMWCNLDAPCFFFISLFLLPPLPSPPIPQSAPSCIPMVIHKSALPSEIIMEQQPCCGLDKGSTFPRFDPSPAIHRCGDTTSDGCASPAGVWGSFLPFPHPSHEVFFFFPTHMPSWVCSPFYLQPILS